MATVSKLLSMTGKAFESLSMRDLRRAVSSLRSTARKRAARLDAKGFDTPALSKLDKEGGIPTIKGMTESELRSEFQKYKNFLNDKTSTISGFKSFRADVIEGLQKRGIDLTNDDFSRFFKAYERLKRLDPNIEAQKLKYDTMRELVNEIENGPPDFNKLVDDMLKTVQTLYESGEKADADEGVSSFFYNT